MKENIWENEKMIVDIVTKYSNRSEILKKIGLRQSTANYGTLNKYIKLYNINISHFNMNNLYKIYDNKKIPLSDILVEQSSYSRTKLKKRLYNEGLKEKKCELCGQDELWQGKKISLILDHINGIHNDNRIENLRIVCPNCNATLDTHCGKNKKNRKIRKIRIKKVYYCEDCGKILNRKAKRCIKCFNKQQRTVERPPYEQLLKEIKELGYCGVGRKYGVSDNAIRKWKNKSESNGICL